jgi:isopenicillin N synthase-like dioxygenase
MEPAMTLTSIPIIDISPYRIGSADGKQTVAEAVAQACRDIGFLVITGHGVSPALVDRVDASARAFFDLPASDKMALKRPKDDQVRGYSAVGDEGLSYSLGEKSPGDLKESFSIGPVVVPDDPYFTGRPPDRISRPISGQNRSRISRNRGKNISRRCPISPRP